MVSALGLGISGAVTTAAAAQQAPVLTLKPTEGPPGTSVTAVASGFDACPLSGGDDVGLSDVDFHWDGAQVVASGKVTGGSASATFPVPDGEPGSHHVAAVCRGDDTMSASAAFTVIQLEPPTLTLDPDEAPPGTQVSAVATGFEDCPPSGNDDVGPGEVVFLWDSQVRLAGPEELSGGTASATISVPESAALGVHQVVARCVGDAGLEAPEGFTVTAAPGTATGDPATPGATPEATPDETVPRAEETPWWPFVVVVLLIALAAVLIPVLVVRTRRGRWWVRAHVRVAPGTVPGLGVAVAEPPRGTPPAVAIRIEPRPHSGTHVIEEAHR